MSYNGSGTFLINTAGQPVVSGTVISSTAFNALTADLATGLSTAITKDGQTTVTANIPMSTYKFTGLGAGSAATDSANLSQVQSTVTKLLTSVSGADTITAVGAPVLSAYAAGQMFYFVAAGDNTTAVTLNIDSLGAKAVTRDGSVALAAGDIKSGEVVVVVYDGTRFQVVSQLNSAGDARFANVSIASALNVGGVATLSGNLTFGSTAQRITGDMSNATITSRLAFQTSTTNGATSVTAIPNGTGVVAAFSAINNSDPTNASLGGVVINASEVRFQSAITGTGTYLPMTFYTNGAEAARFDTSQRFGLGTGANALTNRLTLYASGSTAQYLAAGNSNTGLNGTLFGVDTAGNAVINQTQAFATIFSTSATERMRLDSSGNLGIGTASPSNKLVVSNSGAAGLEIAPTGTASNPTILSYNRSTSAYGQLTFASDFLVFMTNGTNERARITAAGNVVAGGSVALATTATDGFLYVPTCAGTPTGTPTAITGMAPIVVNTTNNKLYFYSGGAWRDAGP